MLHTPRYRRRSAVFRLERLEDRTVLSPLIVTSGADSGTGSLRDTIASAAGGSIIEIAKNVHTITLTSGELDITKSLDIEGLGPNKLTISGNDASRVFDISPGVTVTIAGMTITDGLANKDSPDEPSLGGGILNSGDLTLSEVIVSDCRAIGDASANPYYNGIELGPGFAAGGGVYNAPTLTGGTPTGILTVSHSTFTRNQAQGGSDSIGPSGGYPSNGIFPGSSFGGGIANYGVATVEDSQFTSNLAHAGNGNRWEGTNFAGVAGGGAIANVAVFPPPASGPYIPQLTVRRSSFTHNQAVGGNDNESIRVPGIGLGGAILSHGFRIGAMLTVSDSTFGHNQAIGGNYNLQTGPLLAPNVASGGGVFMAAPTNTQDTQNTISDSTFDHNQAIGGQGLASSDVPSGYLGDVGAGNGGGITVGFNVTYAMVKDCTIEHNQAIGGQAVAGGNGGDASGGGIFNESGPALTVTGCIIDHNQAQGGSADTSGAASNGGSGFGGGVCNDEVSTITVTDSSITHNLAIGASGSNGGKGGNGLGGGFYSSGTVKNLMKSIIEYNLALGGEAGSGGSDGDGIGGGVYLLGTFSIDSTTVVIKKNHASTSNDNIGP